MSKGHTRGRSFEKYDEKPKYPPHPPVGEYDICEKIGKTKNQWSLYPRRRMFND